MEREANRAHSFAEAERWNLQQQWAMTPDERLEIAVRASERSKCKTELRAAGRPKGLDDLDHLPK